MKYRVIGFIFLLIGSLVIVTNKVLAREDSYKESNKIMYTLAKEVSYREVEDTYDFILSIPKINLKKGMYKVGDIRNNIDNNIMIHSDSIYPDNDNSNIILLGHSGSGKKAFFKDLKELDTDSLIELYYKHTKYVYKIDNIYKVLKTETINIENDSNKKAVTLITCDSNNKEKQVVYIGYLIDEIKY